MARYNNITPIISAILLSAFLQVLFVFADIKDTPNKAVVEFTEAYFKMDKSMTDRICNKLKSNEDVNVVDQYIHSVAKEARDRGFDLNYLKSKIYHIETTTISKDVTNAKIRITCERKYPLRSFFTGETYKVDEVMNLIKENDKWKICEYPFSLSETL